MRVLSKSIKDIGHAPNTPNFSRLFPFMVKIGNLFRLKLLPELSLKSDLMPKSIFSRIGRIDRKRMMLWALFRLNMMIRVHSQLTQILVKSYKRIKSIENKLAYNNWMEIRNHISTKVWWMWFLRLVCNVNKQIWPSINHRVICTPHFRVYSHILDLISTLVISWWASFRITSILWREVTLLIHPPTDFLFIC